VNFCPECGAEIKKKIIDGIDRFYCDQPKCNYISWDNPVPVVAAIVEYENKILLAQNASWRNGRYSFITGYLERCEHPEMAAIREVKEELGLDAEVKNFVGHFNFVDKNQIIIVYSVTAEGTINLNSELCDFRLFDEQEILEYLFTYPAFAQSIIKKYLAI